MENVILIGMPGAGKSTFAKHLAIATGRPLYDCDALIVKRAGLSIPDIFERFGEEYFRNLEAEVLKDVSRESGAVIATGGGAILRPENVRAMRQNSRVCLIQRPIDQLPRDGRPNSSSAEAVARLWKTRKALYEGAADFTVSNTTDFANVAKLIQEGFYEAAGH